MAITIKATPGASDANSFATEAEFIAYVSTRLNNPAGTTESGSTCTENEKKALVEATRELTNLPWEGTRADADQKLSWPRAGVVNLDDPAEAEFEDTEIPSFLVDATVELALAFLKAGTTDIASADANEGVIRKITDVLETEWEPGSKRVGLSRFPRVLTLVERYFGETGLSVVRT